MRCAAFSVCGVFLWMANLAFAQTPLETSLCAVAKDPKAFEGKTIRVRGTFHVSFEVFTVSAEGCEVDAGVWVAFGGDVPGIVTSMANDNIRKPGVDMTVNGVSYEIRKDDNFRKLYALLAARRGDDAMYRATATVTGAFLSGDQSNSPDGKALPGYGHLGCCALLVITQAADVTSVPPAALDVRGVVLGPGGKPLAGFTVFDDVLGGWPSQRQVYVTDEDGRFHFTNSGQLLRFEDAKYRPLALAVRSGGAVRSVQLVDAKQSDWAIPACEEKGGHSTRIGFAVRYALPPAMDSQLNDEQGDQRSYFVFPRGGEPLNPELVIVKNLQEDPIPGDAYLDSSWSEQRWISDREGRIVGRDARGRGKNGEHWRTAIFFAHDSANYEIKSGTRAAFVDKIVDSACIASR